MIEIINLTKRFGSAVAIDNVTLTIGVGESVALWGPNGAGKTTIIRCALGLYRFQGTIRVDGVDVQRDGKAARMRIGYVPQELGFYDDLRVSEAVRFFGKLKGLTIHDSDDVLSSVGLSGHGRKRIRELSGGMKQRLALAIALLGNPPILILDEVTAGIDARGRDEFVALLSQLVRRGDRAVLFASHRAEEIDALATRVVTLENGQIVSGLRTEERVYHKPSRCEGATIPLVLAGRLEGGLA